MTLGDLIALYEEVYSDGFFIKEYTGIAAVGDLRDLDALAEEAGQSRDAALAAIPLGYTVDLCWPGRGETREDRVRDGWEHAREMRERGELPKTLAARKAAGLSTDKTKQLGTF